MTASPLDAVLTFCRLLRVAGVRVGLSETRDALSTLAVVDPRWLRRALRATLVKKRADEATFERVFDLYFSRVRGDPTQMDSAHKSGSEERLSPTPNHGSVQESSGGGAASGQDLGEATTYEQLLERAAQFIVRHVYHAEHNARGVQEALVLLGDRVQKQVETPKDPEHVRADLERTFLNALRPEQTAVAIETLLKPADVDQLNFAQLDKSESVLVEAQIERLVKLLLSKTKRRSHSATRGRLDVRRTVRQSLQYGGTPLRLARKKRRIAKPRVFVLTDISSSVVNVVQFLLMLTRVFQHTVGDCRSFVFADETLEISNALQREMDRCSTTGQATQRLIAQLGASGWMARHSDYGASLVQFHQQIQQEVDLRSTVVIFGDARNNRAAPQAHALRVLRQRVKRVLWLNPERKALWDSGDSVMAAYAPYCDHVLECRNLAQLRCVVNQLSCALG